MNGQSSDNCSAQNNLAGVWSLGIGRSLELAGVWSPQRRAKIQHIQNNLHSVLKFLFLMTNIRNCHSRPDNHGSQICESIRSLVRIFRNRIHKCKQLSQMVQLHSRGPSSAGTCYLPARKPNTPSCAIIWRLRDYQTGEIIASISSK
jgi:hypothetical protein